MCAQCREAHGQTRLTKSHKIVDIQPPALHHPRLEQVINTKNHKLVYCHIKYLPSYFRDLLT